MSATNRLLAIVAGFLIGFQGFAQDDDPLISPERLKELKAQKTAYLTTKLSLSQEEAQRFWPVYNEFDEARESQRRQMREMHRSGRDEQGDISEAKAKELLAKGLEMREREVKLERDYSERFVQSIGAVKTLELHKAERDFNREVLRRLRERLDERRDGRNGPPPRRR